MKSFRLHVVESTRHPGQLSLRVNVGDRTATPFYAALTNSGAKVGDVVELRLAPKRKGRRS